MPYFVCGYYMPMELLEWIAIRRVRMRLAGAPPSTEHDK
jgi:hypothetical protein